MYTSKPFSIPSSLSALQALRSSFGDQVYVERADRGNTSFGVLVNHRSYLQNLGVPPDSRHHPSSSSLQHTPLYMRFDFCHAQNQYRYRRNGTVIDLFVGPSHRAAAPWDCTATVAYVLGFKQLASGVIIPDPNLNVCQRRLIRDIFPQLEEMLTAQQLIKKQ